jgi:hypothetical protein
MFCFPHTVAKPSQITTVCVVPRHWGVSFSYRGIFSHNNQYNISLTKFSRLSPCPSLLVFQDSIFYSNKNESLPLFLIGPGWLFGPLFVTQGTSSNLPVHLVSNVFKNSRVWQRCGLNPARWNLLWDHQMLTRPSGLRLEKVLVSTKTYKAYSDMWYWEVIVNRGR